jgi:hypothetical protein
VSGIAVTIIIANLVGCVKEGAIRVQADRPLVATATVIVAVAVLLATC